MKDTLGILSYSLLTTFGVFNFGLKITIEPIHYIFVSLFLIFTGVSILFSMAIYYHWENKNREVSMPNEIPPYNYDRTNTSDSKRYKSY